MTDTSKARPKLPMGNMKVSKAKQRWEDVRKAAQSGDPAAMMGAVSRFQGIADTMLLYFANRDRISTELDDAKARNDCLEQTLCDFLIEPIKSVDRINPEIRDTHVMRATVTKGQVNAAIKLLKGQTDAE